MDEEWSDEDLARALGWVRLLAGALLFFAPRFGTRAWTGEREEGATTQMAVRGMGIRDAALGAGLLIALERGAPARGWLEAGAMADAGDALGTLTSWRDLGRPRGFFWFLAEVGGALFGIELASRLD